MRFEHPDLLWLLLAAVPGLTLFYWWAWRKKRWLISQFVQSRLLANLTVGVSTARQKVRLALLVLAVALLVVVLARPQWGFDWEEARQRGLDIIVALDTSKSMLARDIVPNRLQRAKLAALDLLKQARTDRVGLVAFAGTAFLQCPLSLDDEAFRQSVEALEVHIMPQGGTAFADAIQAARSAFKEKNENHKVLVLFSDGEDHDGHAADAAREAAHENIRIFTVGVGTAKGEVLRVPDSKGVMDFVRDENGQAVSSRLNEPLMREMAQATGGFYMLLSGGETMKVLYERGLEPLPKTEFTAKQVQRWHERFQWFLGLTLMLLVLELLLPERKRVPRSEAILAASTNAGLRRSVALLLFVLFPPGLHASPGTAWRQYEAKRYGAAYREYQRLLQAKPDDPRLQFNAGTSAYQARDYERAQEHFRAALNAVDVRLQQRAYYNLGNTLFRTGEEERDLPKREQSWEQAITSYESALRLQTNDLDATFNLQVVTDRLEALRQSQRPSEAAQRAKAEADAALRRRDYRRAIEIMAQQLQRDPTTTNYLDYIKRLNEIHEIQNPAQP